MLVTGRLVHSKILLLIVLFSCSLNAQTYPDAKVDSLLKIGIYHIVNHNYTEAEKTFSYLNNKFPELPLGKIYLAAAKISYAYDFETPFDEKYIEDNLQRAQTISERLLETNEDDKWHVYFFALTRGYSAYYQAVKGSWLKALRTGLSAVSAFEECLKIDPDFHEAWIAIGTYEYWKSSKTDFLSWLPFVYDNKNLAIERLSHAIDSSVYNTHLAVHSLIWIYIDQKNFKDALELSRSAVKKFPGSRVFKWALARTLEEVDLNESIKIYSDILESYYLTGIRTRINEITLKHIMAQQYVKLGENHKALKICKEIIDLNDLTKYEKEKLGDRLKRIQSLIKELN